MNNICGHCKTNRCLRVNRISKLTDINTMNINYVTTREYKKGQRRPDGSRIFMNGGKIYEVGKNMPRKEIERRVNMDEGSLRIRPIYKNICIFPEEVESVMKRGVKLNGCRIKLINGETIETDRYSVTYTIKWWKKYP